MFGILQNDDRFNLIDLGFDSLQADAVAQRLQPFDAAAACIDKWNLKPIGQRLQRYVIKQHSVFGVADDGRVLEGGAWNHHGDGILL